MKVKAEALLNHIGKANVGGLVNEVVLGDSLKFCVTDDAKSLLSFSSKGLAESDLGTIGLFNLDLLLRSIQYVADSIFEQGEELEMSIVENRLTFKKGVNEFRFMLSNPKVISSTVSNVESAMERIRTKESAVVTLERKTVENCLKAIQLITPEIVTVSVRSGQILCLVGKETDHNSIILLGQCLSSGVYDVKVKPDLLAKVLQTLPVDTVVQLEVRDAYPLVFASENYNFVVIPVEQG